MVSLHIFVLFSLAWVCSSGPNVPDRATVALWKAAVYSNDPEGTRDAIENGANMEWKNTSTYNDTALLWASDRGHVEAMAVLLKAGANKEAVNDFGDRPIHVAAEEGNNAAVAVLTAAGADLHSRGFQGETPLQMAAEFGHNSTMTLLRALGGWR